MSAESSEESERVSRVRALAARMGRAGASLTVDAPGLGTLRVGPEPERTRVVLRDAAALEALASGSHLALAEAYLHGRIDVHGDLGQAIVVTDYLAYEAPSRLREALWFLRLALDRRAIHRRTVSEHYDRPADFFLAWLDETTRSYTHGFYRSPDDDLAAAQARKLQFAIDALGLEPGMEVFDMGCGWGSFLEYAGSRGIRVQGITLSREQHAFVSRRIRELDLPCRVELVDFLDYRPGRAFDGAVFMGSLEHMPSYRVLSRFLRDHLGPRAAVYCDFVTSREGRLGGSFMTQYIFPGASNYVDVPGLLRALLRAGLNIGELTDDTLSCAWTVRDWARRLEKVRDELATRHGELPVRAFLLYLWSSYHFLATNRTQAYHVVASRLPREDASRSTTASAQSAPKRSPIRA
ncbi:MAG TPA: class I SAM-dependent methyltransferase [Myxococcota bacterium]|nr:class I SAM-dependent methyltransferase [Myxococcota bacterium]